jgi:hypothetical protein
MDGPSEASDRLNLALRLRARAAPSGSSIPIGSAPNWRSGELLPNLAVPNFPSETATRRIGLGIQLDMLDGIKYLGCLFFQQPAETYADPYLENPAHTATDR